MRVLSASICAVLLLGLLASVPADAAGSKPATTPTPSPSASDISPEEAAKSSYNLGLKHRDKAWALEDKAKAAETDADREKLLGKAQKQYEKAIPLFKTATERVPSFHQAFSSLGYALRKTGDFDGSLKAYDTALELAPFYGEAIEYRGEAYLGLNRVDEAKEAYMQLFDSNRALADELMEAMHGWLEQRQADPAGVSEDTLKSFATWVKERGTIAEQTARLAEAASRAW